MTTIDLPKLDTIKKFVRSGPAEEIRVARPVEKNGTPLATAGDFRSQWMEVTPPLAAAWLKNNFRNRPVAEDVVAAYARDMVNGVWIATHQGIAFNDRDELIDGQHRLMAVVKSGQTIRMMVTFGLPAKIAGREMTTMDCVDRGRTRSVADQLKIQHGLPNGTQIAQIASALSGLCHERVRRLSVGQTLDIYRLFKTGMDFVIENRSKESGLKSAGVLAGFAFVIQADDACLTTGGAVREMFYHLNSPDQKNEHPVIKLLHEFLTGQNASLILASMNRGIAELTVQAVWLALQKSKVDKLEFSLDGTNHFRAQQPERVAKVAAMFKLPVAPKVEPVVESHSTASRTPAQLKAKKIVCECGRKYDGPKHKNGCPHCRKYDGATAIPARVGVAMRYGASLDGEAL